MKISFLILCLNSSDGHDAFILLFLKETCFDTIKIGSFAMYFLGERLCHIRLTPKFLVAVCSFPSIQDATVIPHLMALLSRSRYTQEYICQIFSHCCKVRTRVNVLTVNLCVFSEQRTMVEGWHTLGLLSGCDCDAWGWVCCLTSRHYVGFAGFSTLSVSFLRASFSLKRRAWKLLLIITKLPGGEAACSYAGWKVWGQCGKSAEPAAPQTALRVHHVLSVWKIQFPCF